VRSLSAHRGTDEEIRQEHDEAQERNGKKHGSRGLAQVDRVVFHMTDFCSVFAGEKIKSSYYKYI
jgi:hypothetical protein